MSGCWGVHTRQHTPYQNPLSLSLSISLSLRRRNAVMPRIKYSRARNLCVAPEKIQQKIGVCGAKDGTRSQWSSKKIRRFYLSFPWRRRLLRIRRALFILGDKY